MFPAPPVLFGLLGSSLACAETGPCEGWGEPIQQGTIGDSRVDEASGLAASRVHDDLLWTHNDRGNEPVLYALGSDGRARGSLTLTGTEAQDWEDLALGVDGSGGAALFVGDIGDNSATRSSVQVLRLAEPSEPDGEDSTSAVDLLELTWPDGAADAEGLAVDPKTNDLVLATKEKDRSRIYRASALAEHGSSQQLSLVGEVDLSSGVYDGGHKVTAIDFSPDGARLLMRTAAAVLVFQRDDDEPLDELLQLGSCLAPAPDEPEAEALAAVQTGFFTTGEGADAPLWQVQAP